MESIVSTSLFAVIIGVVVGGGVVILVTSIFRMRNSISIKSIIILVTLAVLSIMIVWFYYMAIK